MDDLAARTESEFVLDAEGAEGVYGNIVDALTFPITWVRNRIVLLSQRGIVNMFDDIASLMGSGESLIIFEQGAAYGKDLGLLADALEVPAHSDGDAVEGSVGSGDSGTPNQAAESSISPWAKFFLASSRRDDRPPREADRLRGDQVRGHRKPALRVRHTEGMTAPPAGNERKSTLISS